MDVVVLVATISIFVISLVFSMFGQGGGSLYTPVLFLLGYATSTSASTSLVLNLLTALTTTVVYYRGGLVDIRRASLFVPGTVTGSLIGGVLSESVNPNLLMWLFVAFLVGAGARMLYTYWEARRDEAEGPAPFSRGIIGVIVALSFAVGILSGLLGVGGGIVIVPFLIFACKYPMRRSAGAAAFIVVFSSLFGVIGHSAAGHLDASLIATTAGAVLIGAVLGALLTTRTKSRTIKAGFGLIMLLFAAQLIVKLIGVVQEGRECSQAVEEARPEGQRCRQDIDEQYAGNIQRKSNDAQRF